MRLLYAPRSSAIAARAQAFILPPFGDATVGIEQTNKYYSTLQPKAYIMCE